MLIRWTHGLGLASGLAALLAAAPAQVAAQVRSPQSLAQLADSVNGAGGRVIILLKSSSTQARVMAPGSNPLSDSELNQIKTRLESTGVAINQSSPMIGAVFARVDAGRLAALNSDPNVLMMEADRIMYLRSAPGDRPAYPRSSPVDVVSSGRARALSQDLPWGISQITAPGAWALGFRGGGVKVGIMDSGGDSTHPDLVYAGGYSAVTGGTNPSDWADNIASCNGHGTHVAGTVAAKDNNFGVVGVAPDASLYAIKVFEDLSGGCGAWISTQITAVNWAADNGIRVVNASLGGSWSYTYQLAVDQAAARGTFFVAAAGNDNGGPVEFPAAFPSAIAVASLTSSNTRSSFSDIGPEIAIGAPGEGIESTLPGGGYGFKSGTSMATPHVTGSVALLVQQNPGITLAGVRAALQSGALDIDAPGYDQNTGWGLVRILNSLQGGGSPPLTLSLSALARSVSVAVGGNAPSDNATVTLSGTGAASTVWTATKRKSWTTLTTASGTGSGTVAWNRSAAGLPVGTYVDTITVTAAGAASGSPATIFDTLTVTSAAVPVALAVSPSSRNVTVAQGGSAPGDNASVTLTGTNAGSTAWSASKKKSWTTLTTANGTGSGTVAWSRTSGSLGVGVYVDTITVTAPGAASGSPAIIYDTLQVTNAVVPVALALAPSSRNVVVAQGTAAPGDNAAVTLTGTNAASTAWTAINHKSWNTLTVTSGTGNGAIAWNRNSTGMGPGTYVDTIRVIAPGAASGSPATLYDTLRITATAVPIALAVSPSSRNVTVTQGTGAPLDNASVTLTGTNAASTTWTATKKQSWTTLTTASGTGSGTVTWSRASSGLAAGIYVDTITVTALGAASGSPTMVYDTLQVTANAVPVALSLAPGSRNVAVLVGTNAPGDNAVVTLSGTNGASTAWTVINHKSWTVLTVTSGTGSGTISWNRNSAGLTPGTYVDTIRVIAPGAASGSPATLYDTLRVTTTAIPVTIAVSPGSRSNTVQQGALGPSDTVAVTLGGTGAGATAWTATSRKSWTVLTAGNGVGSGAVSWNRNTSGLALGTYVDTITVSAAGAASAFFYDSVLVTRVVLPIVATVSPASRRVTVQLGGSAPSGTAVVALSGTNAATTGWSVASRAGWNTLTANSGTGSGTFAWNRSAAGLGVGNWVDTFTVTVATGATATLVDTLTITALAVPVTLTVSPTYHRVTVVQGSAVSGDNATVSLTGTNGAATAWTATNRRSWNILATNSGTGNGTITWSRNVSTLVVGTYVDTITVSAPTAAGSPVSLYDTVRITPRTALLGLRPGSRHTRIFAVGRGSSVMDATRDSALVEVDGGADPSDIWSATTTASRLQILAPSGPVGSALIWQRAAITLPVGVYIDSMQVQLQRDSTIRGMFVDTLEIVSVALPDPTAAVEDLFHANRLSDDQRTMLDLQGNGNGKYDIGDLLAWVDKQHIRLTPAVAGRLQQLMLRKPAKAPAGPGTEPPR